MAQQQVVKQSSSLPKLVQSHPLLSTVQDNAQEKSVQTIQTLLFCALSSMSFVRGLFPGNCFQKYILDHHSSQKDDYSTEKRRRVSRNSTAVRLLERGINDRADKFLDTLEKGVVDALRKSVLSAVQVDIFEDKDKPSHVMEMYTFTIKYANRAGSQQRVAGMNLNSLSGPPIELSTNTGSPNGLGIEKDHTMWAMQQFMREMIAQVENMPRLPGKRYLRFHIFYLDSCTPSYEAPGFTPAQTNEVMMHNGIDWKMDSLKLRAVNTGFHSMSMRIAYLAPQSPEAPQDIPQDLDYNYPSTRESELDAEGVFLKSPIPSFIKKHTQSETAPAGEQISQDMPQPLTQSSQATVYTQDRNPNIELHGSQGRRSFPAPSPAGQRFQRRAKVTRGPISESAEEYTRGPPANPYHSQDMRTKMQLKKMAEWNGETQNQDLEPTQRVLSSLRQSDISDQEPVQEHALCKLAATNLDELPDLKALAQNRKIDCECGWNEDGGDGKGNSLVMCNSCNTWQHSHCYGYEDTDRSRIFDKHVCYICLLQGQNEKLLREMRNVTFLRRALAHIREHGYKSPAEFSQFFDGDMTVAGNAFSRFKKDGHVVSVKGKGGRGNRRGYQHWEMVKTEPKLAEIKSTYLNPLWKIGHLLGKETHQSSDSHAETRATSMDKHVQAIHGPNEYGELLGNNGQTKKNQRCSANMLAENRQAASQADRVGTPGPLRKRNRDTSALGDGVGISAPLKKKIRISVAQDILSVGSLSP